jgi:hypothetical protein
MFQPIDDRSSTRSLPFRHLSRRSPWSAFGTVALGVAFSAGCSDEGGDPSTGGTGGASTGGAHTGGTSTGGANTGGMSTGGTNTGGMSTGGASTGGTSTGGTSLGGASTGGTAATTGGASNGGTSNAGATNGGSSGGPGGTSGAAGGGAGGAAAGGAAGGGSGGAKMSAGCSTTPATLKSATVNQATPVNSIMVGGQNRQFLTRWPANYDSKKAYPLHLGLHGANGNISENGRDNFGLWSLSKDSVIFVTLVANGGLWSAASDLTYADAVLKQVESELCIDTSKIVLEGFSQGAAMSWYLLSRDG